MKNMKRIRARQSIYLTGVLLSGAIPHPVEAGNVLDNTVRDKLFTEAGFNKTKDGWKNECGRLAALSADSVDLDNAGHAEVIITSDDQVCYGQVGARNLVFKKDASGSWRLKLVAHGFLQVGTRRRNGHLDLVFGGAGLCGNEVYSWRNGKYSYVCNVTDSETPASCAHPGRRSCKNESAP